MKQLIIQEREAGQRLDKYLGKYLSNAPKSFVYKMLRKKNITLNEKKASGSEKLTAGDKVLLFFSEETLEKFTGKCEDFSDRQKISRTFSIIYEDDQVLIVSKPAGLLSQKGEKTDVSLVEEITQYLLDTKSLDRESLKTFRPGICNRLDRNTSGLVTAGKTLEALQQLSKIFHDRTVEKYYICLVQGVVTTGSHIKGYLSKNERSNKVSLSTDYFEGSVPIETSYIPLANNGKITVLKVHLITGRTHQIRAHLASVGHPIIGDNKYGNGRINQKYKEKYGLNHQLLHAMILEMPHMDKALASLSGKRFLAPVPKAFQQILDREHLGEINYENE